MKRMILHTGLASILLLAIQTVSHAQGALSCNPTAVPPGLCGSGLSQLYANASGGSGIYTYVWTSNPPGFWSSLADPEVYPMQTTIYTVTVSDGYNVVMGAVTVTVFDPPIADAGVDQSIPYGTSTTLNGSATGGSGSYSFEWTPENLLVNPFVNNPTTVNLTSTTMFQLTVTDNQTGCISATDQVMVTITGGPLGVSVGVYPGSIHLGESSQLTAQASGGSGSYSYSWSSDPPGFSSTLPNPVVFPMVTTTFNVWVNDGYNMANAMGTVYVETTPLPLQVTVEPSADTICLGAAVTLHTNCTGGSGNFTFAWSSDPEGFWSTQQSPVVNPLVNTVYTVVVDDGFSVVSAAGTVIVQPVLTLYTITGGGMICEGSAGRELLLDGSQEGIEYKLLRNGEYTGTSVVGTGAPFSFGYQNMEGEYTARAVNLQAGCEDLMNGTATIGYIHFDDPTEICMITVDSLTGRNIVLWEKNPDTNIVTYNIYRESTLVGNFELIGNVPHGSPGSFMDMTANPLQRSFSYTLSKTDVCGNMTGGNIHTTMHLSINTGINSYNLLWSPYTGFFYETYYIYRRHFPDGFQVIDSVPASIQSYSDLNPPAGMLDYMVGIRKEGGCTIQRGLATKTMVFSNVISTNVGIGEGLRTGDHFTVSPNPGSGRFIFDLKKEACSVRVFSAEGLLVKDCREDIHGAGRFTVDLTNAGKGMYFALVIFDDGTILSRKIILQ